MYAPVRIVKVDDAVNGSEPPTIDEMTGVKIRKPQVIVTVAVSPKSFVVTLLSTVVSANTGAGTPPAAAQTLFSAKNPSLFTAVA